MTERLKDKSPIIEGSATSNCPFFNFSDIILSQFLLNLTIKFLIKKIFSKKKKVLPKWKTFNLY
jgi:hypothetical protein